MPIAWGLDSELAAAINPMTSKVSLYLAEFARGHRDELELHELLSRAVATVALSTDVLATAVVATTSQETRSVPYLAVAAVGTGA